MALYKDLESILDEVLSALKTTLNAKIDAIQTEKSAGDLAAGIVIDLKHVDDKAYFLQSLNGDIAAFDPFILYGVEDQKTEGNGNATLKIYKINVVLCASDTGQEREIARRMLRYSRALEQTFQGYFAGISYGFKVNIESLTPVQFTLMNSTNDYRAVGVSLEIGMA